MDEKNAELLRSRSRATFDAQAPTYDTGMEGEHARRLYPHVLAEVRRAVEGNPTPHLLDLGCGTGALAELVLEGLPGARLSCVDLSPRMAEAARAPGRAGRRPALRRRAPALPRRLVRRRLVQRLLPPLPGPRAGGIPGVARARARRDARRRRRVAAGARPRGHERVDASLEGGRRPHLLRGRDAEHPRHLVQRRVLAPRGPDRLRRRRA